MPQVKRWEYLWIKVICLHLCESSIDNPLSSLNKSQGCYLLKGNLECFNSEYLSSIEGNDTYEPSTRSYNVTIKKVVYREYVSLKEIDILSRCRHPNIQSLLGLLESDDGTIRIIYKHISHKYLYGCLNDGNLTWEKRLKICINVAHGLNYLHNGMEDQKTVIHCNINSKNIELDDLSGAKIIGFHNSVFLPPNQDGKSFHLNNIVGDKYYMDPEFAKTRRLKRESDIFSFGIVLLEILCGKCAADLIKKRGL
ncbi:probable serine/threonine-protein kinase PBL28 [Rutidosis leptorrhynchoides]|uniref:probable serine/threonine-protein kinase PBL28 n=1 Tax=Rutidosis leptorrhynchoides TaxID=125765 RepID=UPI003A99565E